MQDEINTNNGKNYDSLKPADIDIQKWRWGIDAIRKLGGIADLPQTFALNAAKAFDVSEKLQSEDGMSEEINNEIFAKINQLNEKRANDVKRITEVQDAVRGKKTGYTKAILQTVGAAIFAYLFVQSNDISRYAEPFAFFDWHCLKPFLLLSLIGFVVYLVHSRIEKGREENIKNKLDQVKEKLSAQTEEEIRKLHESVKVQSAENRSKIRSHNEYLKRDAEESLRLTTRVYGILFDAKTNERAGVYAVSKVVAAVAGTLAASICQKIGALGPITEDKKMRITLIADRSGIHGDLYESYTKNASALPDDVEACAAGKAVFLELERRVNTNLREHPRHADYDWGMESFRLTESGAEAVFLYQARSVVRTVDSRGWFD